MSTKEPIYLKRGSRKGKKGKLRDILSSDMISPPLGDFRHTIHIGSSGGENDIFGDMSFLQGKFHLLPGKQGHSLSQKSSLHTAPFEFTRTASVCGHQQQSQLESTSPLLKNAISLPVFEVQSQTLPSTQAQMQAPPPKPPRLHLGSRSDTPGDKSSQNDHREEHSLDEPYLSHAGSLLSLHLDLGPSILDDVLQIMDKHQMGRINGARLPEIFT
uniref:CDC42 effector protein (Rho GTPase binding) 2 n=1 Tax=Erpetoichthys calabaricus TaxID=27687 RepID=A0A8C4RGL0_ERPCA